MLKHFVLAASAAALVLAGCTKVETVEIADQNLISFGDSFIGNPTKAVTEVTTDNIDHFYAYGAYETSTNVFTNQLVEKAENGEWVYSDLVPWVDNQPYKFVAYSLPAPMSKGTPDFDYTSGELTITDYVVDKENSDEDLLVSDLVERNSGDAASDRSLVKFTFNHALAWIVFDLASGFDQKYTVEITKATFYNMLSKRTYETNAWTGGNATDAIAKGNAMTLPTAGMSGAGEGTDNLEKITSGTNPVNGKLNFYVIPQAIPSSVTLEIAATVSDGADFNEEINLTATIPIDAVSTWDMGFKYTYKATITGTDTFITFDAPEVNEWQGKNNGIDLGDL